MRTANRMNGDFGFAEGTFFFRLFLHFLFRVQALKLVKLADYKEYDKTDHQEIDKLSQKCAVIDGGGIFAASKNDPEIIKIDFAGKYAQQRHENVVDQGAYDAGKGASDYHAYGQVYHISL